MMPDISEAESAFLEAKADFEQWQAEFMAEWFGPYEKTAVQLFWGRIPEDVKAQLRARVPDAVERVEQLAGGKNGSNRRR